MNIKTLQLKTEKIAWISNVNNILLRDNPKVVVVVGSASKGFREARANFHLHVFCWNDYIVRFKRKRIRERKNQSSMQVSLHKIACQNYICHSAIKKILALLWHFESYYARCYVTIIKLEVWTINSEYIETVTVHTRFEWKTGSRQKLCCEFISPYSQSPYLCFSRCLRWLVQWSNQSTQDCVFYNPKTVAVRFIWSDH